MASLWESIARADGSITGLSVHIALVTWLLYRLTEPFPKYIAFAHAFEFWGRILDGDRANSEKTAGLQPG
jgi:hypothetical protein